MNRTTQASYAEQMTPWGLADSRTQYGPGVVFYTTPSHGGFQLNAERLAQLRAIHGDVKTFCGLPHWFEEDCDWAYVATAFPDLFTADELSNARATLAWAQRKQPANESAQGGVA